MKQRFAAIIMSAILLTGWNAMPVFAENTGVVTADRLNVRKGPSTGETVIAKLKNGETVEILEKTENGWYKIRYSGNTAYVSSDYIETGDGISVKDSGNEAEKSEEDSEKAQAEKDSSKETSENTDSSWEGEVLTASKGVVYGPSGKETYYNLDMSGVVSLMRDMGNTDEYWVREDGVKMLGEYVMCAANLQVHPRGSLVETSLGTGIVCDTGGFAAANPNQLDIAVTW